MFFTVAPIEGEHHYSVSMQIYSGNSTEVAFCVTVVLLCVCVCAVQGSKGPLMTSLVGIGTSGGPAAPLVNMLLLSGPKRHTSRYHMHR